MAQPSIEELNEALDEVDTDYPMSAGELAEKTSGRENVRSFFEMIPSDTMFEGRAEVLSMAEQVEGEPTEA